MQMDTLEKLRYLIDNKLVTRYLLSKELRISRTTLTNYYEGTTSPNSLILDTIEKYINDKFEVEIENIEKKQIKKCTNDDNCTRHYEELAGKAIPHIDVVTAECGLPNGFDSAIMEGDCERYIIPDMPGCDFTIRARGRSMINRSFPERSINDRDIVGCRIVRTRSHIRWGEVYALATRDGLIIKRIEPSEREGYIKCVSFNEEERFGPYDIPLDEIYDWALVAGVVSVKTWV